MHCLILFPSICLGKVFQQMCRPHGTVLAINFHNLWVENVLNENMPAGYICLLTVFIETARNILGQTHLIYGSSSFLLQSIAQHSSSITLPWSLSRCYILFTLSTSVFSLRSLTLCFFFFFSYLNRQVDFVFLPCTSDNFIKLLKVLFFLFPHLPQQMTMDFKILKPLINYPHSSSPLMDLSSLMCHFLSCQVYTPSSVITEKFSFGLLSDSCHKFIRQTVKRMPEQCFMKSFLVPYNIWVIKRLIFN